MEPLATIGLAGNIVQFLDLGRRLVSGAVELYNASDGATSSNRVLDETSTDLHRLCRGLEQGAKNFRGHLGTESEAALLPLVKSCSALGEELKRVLEELKVKGGNKGWKSARVALKTAWKAKDIGQYEKKLDLYRSQIATCLLTILT